MRTPSVGRSMARSNWNRVRAGRQAGWTVDWLAFVRSHSGGREMQQGPGRPMMLSRYVSVGLSTIQDIELSSAGLPRGHLAATRTELKVWPHCQNGFTWGYHPILLQRISLPISLNGCRPLLSILQNLLLRGFLLFLCLSINHWAR